MDLQQKSGVIAMRIRWDLEHVYLYLVCFVALILIIIGAVNLTQTAIAYVTPGYDYYGPYGPGELERDLEIWEERFGAEFVAGEKERYETLLEENQRRRLIRDLVSGLAFVGVAAPVYLYHWRKIGRLESKNIKSNAGDEAG